MYSGLLGTSLALAGLSSQIHGPWHNYESSSHEVSQDKTVEKKVSSPSAPPPRFSSLAKAQQEIDQALSWNELRHFPNNVYQDFIQQLAQEEFENGHPFILASQRKLWKQVLGHGLKDYSRKIYRSPHFQSRSGYDLIQYELLLGNDQKAYLLAYREKTEDTQIIVGEDDLRPTRIDLYLQQPNESEQTWSLVSYQITGETIQHLSLNQDDFLASRDAIVDLSVPLLTAGR